jgi:hypothetical protein
MEGITVSFSTDFGQFPGSVPYIEVGPTDASGVASVIISSNSAGTANVRAWLDDDGDDAYTPGELTDPTLSVKVWQEPDQLDYGDAPDSYGTLSDTIGARHVVGAVHLGLTVDSEPDGQPSAQADGDDLNGASPDDEDGVLLLPVLVPGFPAIGAVDGGPVGGMLDAWIDFNGNGFFDSPAEHLWGGASQAMLPIPANPISFPVQATAGPGPTYARFRLSTNGGLPPTGLAPDGEVEDYRVSIQGEPQGVGTIVIQKTTDPPGGSDFDFLDNFDIPFVMNDGDSLAIPLPAGTYVITEPVPVGWAVPGSVCETDDDGDTSSWGGNVVTIDLDADETITCTFNNAQLATVVLVKRTDPPLDIAFDFLNDLGIVLPEISIPANVAVPIPFVPAGTYVITETVPDGWEITGLECVKDGQQDGWSRDGNAVTIDVDPGETITCTFDNAMLGTVILEKRTVPPVEVSFDFLGDFGIFLPDLTIPANIVLSIPFVPAGTYSIAEADPGPLGWELSDIYCEDPDGGSSVDFPSRSATIELDPGETVHCVFINGRPVGGSVAESRSLGALTPGLALFALVSVAGLAILVVRARRK